MDFNIDIDIFDNFKKEFVEITITLIKEVLKWKMKHKLLDIKDYSKEEKYLVKKLLID